MTASTKLFDAAIDDATMKDMEAGASSKERGVARRVTLLVLARDEEALSKFSLEQPEAFDEMRSAVDGFQAHARALLEAAEAASLRMRIADRRSPFPIGFKPVLQVIAGGRANHV